MQDDSLVWVESFRPKTIDECILPARIKTQLEKMVESGNIQNYSAIGSPGSGKTSSARALCDQLNVEYLMINMSNESGIDTVRTKIVNFANTMSFKSDYKVIILDEFDYANCLHENESVRVGTIDNWSYVKLKDLAYQVEHPIVSFNMQTGELENDTGFIVEENDNADLYEITMDDGRTVQCTASHPFIVLDADGNYIERSINDGLSVNDTIVGVAK